MSGNENPAVIEISKRKMADIYYRKRVCRCLTSKVISLAQSRIDENKRIIQSIMN